MLEECCCGSLCWRGVVVVHYVGGVLLWFIISEECCCGYYDGEVFLKLIYVGGVLL